MSGDTMDIDEAVDHIRGPVGTPVILMYGDPHALAASLATEAAHQQARFWNMHDLLFHRQKALTDEDLREYAADLELGLGLFESDWISRPMRDRVRRDQQSASRSGHVKGTPTLFIDGAVHHDDYAANTLLEKLRS
jgi:NhaA family Na+:H+ antiporter